LIRPRWRAEYPLSTILSRLEGFAFIWSLKVSRGRESRILAGTLRTFGSKMGVLNLVSDCYERTGYRRGTRFSRDLMGTRQVAYLASQLGEVTVRSHNSKVAIEPDKSRGEGWAIVRRAQATSGSTGVGSRRRCANSGVMRALANCPW
jgi:hypothetical protein